MDRPTLTAVTGPARSEKGEQTREAIAQAALSLFRERGYEKTTMRAVAERAGVSLGNAYYYFGSKEHLVQAFYDELRRSHERRADATWPDSKSFASRLQALLEAWIDVAEPYHEFAGKFFKIAAEPTSPLSPFSAESEPARLESVALMARCLDGSDLKVPAALRRELPDLLWLAQMGMVLFWVYDGSPDRQRTRALVRTAAPLLDRLLRLTRLPGVRAVAEDLVGVVVSIRRAGLDEAIGESAPPPPSGTDRGDGGAG